jgi:hypothetical protein
MGQQEQLFIQQPTNNNKNKTKGMISGTGKTLFPPAERSQYK